MSKFGKGSKFLTALSECIELARAPTERAGQPLADKPPIHKRYPGQRAEGSSWTLEPLTRMDTYACRGMRGSRVNTWSSRRRST